MASGFVSVRSKLVSSFARMFYLSLLPSDIMKSFAIIKEGFLSLSLAREKQLHSEK